MLQGTGSVNAFTVKVAPRKGSVSLSQKSVLPSITFNEQESPGDPNTIPDGQLQLTTLGSYGP